MEQVVDVVVIGAGAAGLAAARSLGPGLSRLVLEREARIGGRIRTDRVADHLCEMGATVGYSPEKTPFPISPSPFIQEAGPIAVLVQGRLYEGETPEMCPADWSAGAEPLRTFIAELASDPSARSAAALADVAGEVVEACFNVMHPGRMARYGQAVWRDTLHRFYPSHHLDGNSELPRQLADGTPCLTGVEVLTLSRAGETLLVEGRGPEGPLTVRGRRVVLATDAEAAKVLIQPLDERLSRRLAAITYGAFVSFADEVEIDPDADRLSYVVDGDGPTTVMVQLRTPDPARRHRLTLFGGARGDAAIGLSDAQVSQMARDAWRRAGWSTPKATLGTSLVRWPRAGTVITPQLISQGFGDPTGVEGRVLLAGDYLTPPHYGVQAALRAGMAAARRSDDGLADTSI